MTLHHFNRGAAGNTGGYQISRSLRFNSADSAYLNRTPASASNRTTWTYSAWVKLSSASTRVTLLEQSVANTDAGYLLISILTDASSNNLVIEGYNTVFRRTTASYRDFSAWYHIVVAVDTTQATANNRVRLYINGVEVTAFGTTNNPTQNADTGVNSTGAAYLGRTVANSAYSNAYMTEINLIDGQALTPSSFGETNAQTGVWQPKAYSGTYGTNGFYLNFSDNSNTTAATLGKDYSGNGNNWTPNNFSVTAGAGNDSLVDSPTSYGTDTGVGGTVRGNYATLNPLLGSTATLSNGNLNMVVGTTATKVLSTIGMSSGKWYWEYSYTDISGDGICGIATSQASITAHVGLDAYSWGYVAGTGNKVTNSSSSAYGASYTTNDVIGVAFDADAGTLVFYKNGTSQGTAYSSLTSGPYFPAFGDNAAGASSTLWANFGQRPFAYTAPSGYKALCTQNLPTPTIGATSTTLATKYFNPVIYTGNGTTQAISGVGFQPDFTWIKDRNAGYDHQLFDINRGVLKTLQTDNTNAEATYSNSLTSWAADGFNLGGANGTNINGYNFVAWNWKASGTTVSNTSGTITSTVSANTTSGFSIATFTSQASGTATVGHGLGVAPSMVIVKGRNVAYEWYTYHVSLGASAYVSLSNTAASASSTTLWNATSPTSSVFSLGTAWTGSNTFVAYCFAEVAGYSKFGSYTGNGSSDGVFVYTGMRPAFLMIKRVDAVGEDWFIYDTTRSPNNANNLRLEPNLSDAEVATSNVIDFLSNGFKLRNTATSQNSNGINYIFAAFASAPQKFSLAR